jgi:spermidine synthase
LRKETRGASSAVRGESIRIKPAAADDTPPESLTAPDSSPNLVPLLFLFAGSGCAGLIYEVVWFQLLEFVIGASGVSLGLLLAAYMGGLCLGSVALARFVSRRQHPMRVYAALELGIAIFGVLALFGIPLIGRAYAVVSPAGIAGLIMRGIVAAVCLLPPTVLMGASLPAISRAVGSTARGVTWMGLLYSANIAGAVIGCLLAGFYLLRVHDMALATWAAAGINLAVAAGAWILARSRSRAPLLEAEAGEAEAKAEPPAGRGATLVYAVIGLSGLTALGAEVVWTRLLSLLLGSTVYTFSIILAVFLLGLWGGSSAGSYLARRTANPRFALALSQIFLAVAIAWTTFTLVHVMPWWPVDPELSVSPWFNFDLDVTRCLRTILPATLLWGASFPLALAAAAAKGEDPARLSGRVYAANTAGSILGALAFSLLLIPSFGTRDSQRILIWCAAASGAIALWGVSFRHKTHRWAGIAGTLVLAAGLTATVSDMPWQAMAYGRRIAPILRDYAKAANAESKPLFLGEGINSSVVITGRGDQRFFFVSGKSEASSAPIDMRLQRMMGHLPALFHRSPKSVLVVGFGAGVTAGSFVPYSGIESITVCELESLIPPASDEFFGKENNHVLQDSRTKIVHDDARHYVLTTPQKFDVITTDPIHPWVKGTSTLYTKQYYEMEKSHLNPGGVVAQWLPIYESDEETVKTELATFFSVFPNGTVWSNYLDGDGYDLVLIGREDSGPIDVDAMDRMLSMPEYRAVAASLAEVDFRSAAALMSSYAGRASDLAPMTAGVPLNEDLNMRLQYLAGAGVNSQDSPQIYRSIMEYRRFPEGLLVGAPERMDLLRTTLNRRFRIF